MKENLLFFHRFSCCCCFCHYLLHRNGENLNELFAPNFFLSSFINFSNIFLWCSFDRLVRIRIDQTRHGGTSAVLGFWMCEIYWVSHLILWRIYYECEQSSQPYDHLMHKNAWFLSCLIHGAFVCYFHFLSVWFFVCIFSLSNDFTFQLSKIIVYDLIFAKHLIQFNILHDVLSFFSFSLSLSVFLLLFAVFLRLRPPLPLLHFHNECIHFPVRFVIDAPVIKCEWINDVSLLITLKNCHNLKLQKEKVMCASFSITNATIYIDWFELSKKHASMCPCYCINNDKKVLFVGMIIA